MTEWQKMISGEIFENSDPEICAASSRAKNLCRLYNNNNHGQFYFQASNIFYL